MVMSPWRKEKNIQCRNCIDLNRIITKDRVDVSFTKRSYSALPMASLQSYLFHVLFATNEPFSMCGHVYEESSQKIITKPNLFLNIYHTYMSLYVGS